MKMIIMLSTLLNMYQAKWSNDYFEVRLYDDVTQFFEVPSALLHDNEGNLVSSEATYLRGVNRTDLSVVNSQHVKTFRIDYRVFFYDYGLSFDHTITFKIIDDIAPIINDLDDITILLNSKVPTQKQLIEGMDYYDNYYKNEELMIRINGLELVNNKTVGNYPLEIAIKDPSNNYNYYEIFLRVFSNDGPVVKYTAPIIFNYGNVFNYYDYFKISDSTSNSFAVDLDLSLINFNKIGKYHLSLVVTNSNNVSTYISTEFYIIDNQKPNLTISNNQTINVNCYDDSILRNYIIDVSDNYNDLNIDDVSIKHQVDFNKIGKYDVYYEVKDDSNNISSKVLILEIKDLEKPVIKLKENLVIEVFTKQDYYNYFNISDNYNSYNELEIKFDDKQVDYKIVGYYYLIVEASDLSKNKISERFRVEIKDLTSPVVNLVNEIVITDFKRKELEFFKSHFSVSDNYSTYDEINLNYNDQFNYNEVGIYDITFIFSDSSNNVTSISVDIYIIDNEPPTLKLSSYEIIIELGSKKLNYYNYIDYINDNYTSKDLLNVIIKDNVCYTEIGCYEVIFQLFDCSLNEVKKYLTVYIDFNATNLIAGQDLKINQNSNFTVGMGLLVSDYVVKLDSFPKAIDTSKVTIVEVTHIAYDIRGNSSMYQQFIEIVPNNKFNIKKYSLIIIINITIFSYLGYLYYQDKKYLNFDNK